MITPTQRTAQTILAQAGRTDREPRLPPIAELAALARDYLARTNADGRETLADGEALYVSYAAAKEYLRVVDAVNQGSTARVDEARRELTELLIDARQSQADPSSWRVRAQGLDVQALVAVDGRLLVVTHVNVRQHITGGQR